MESYLTQIIYGGSPKNHHLILNHLKKFNNTTLIRFDNHSDYVTSIGFSLPYARYMNIVIKEDYFNNILWIKKNKKEEFEIKDYKDIKLRIKDYNKVLKYVEDNSKGNIVLDIDPDILFDYPTDFSKGSMTFNELKTVVKYFMENKNVQLLFCASPQKFIEELLN